MSAIKLALVVCGIGLTMLASAARAQNTNPLRYKRSVVSGKEAVVGFGVRWNNACRVIGVPEVALDVAPERGFVCIRRGVSAARNVLFGGATHCLNDPKMNGVQVIYQSRLGYAGDDLFGYTLKYPRGARRYLVTIDVKPGSVNRTRDQSMLERQPHGPMPECAALVS